MLKENRQDIFFIHREFPSNEHLEQYISSIHNRDEQEIRWLLRRFLIPSGNFGQPLFIEIHIANVKRLAQENPEYLLNSEFYRRFLSN
jgi:hypothetical protein